MSDPALEAIREIIQEDVGGRGLRADPAENLITACAGDFAGACRDLAGTLDPALAIVTGFFIPHGQPPCAETDGPLGAIFLARALLPLGFRMALLTDFFCKRALEAGLAACGLERDVVLLSLPSLTHPREVYIQSDWQKGFLSCFPLTHLMAIERAGPSHTPESIRAQPGADPMVIARFLHEVLPAHHDRCHTMAGRDVTAAMSPAHLLFEAAARRQPPLRTIGIGDGGNEIGMGKIPWGVIRRNIPNGGLVACRVATDFLIVCGVSNWGAYGLAAGVRYLRGARPDRELFDPERERKILEAMVERGPLVDGLLGRRWVSVDGVPFERYAECLCRLEAICRKRAAATPEPPGGA